MSTPKYRYKIVRTTSTEINPTCIKISYTNHSQHIPIKIAPLSSAWSVGITPALEPDNLASFDAMSMGVNHPVNPSTSFIPPISEFIDLTPFEKSGRVDLYVYRNDTNVDLKYFVLLLERVNS